MRKPKILQINSTANWGSTGKIAEQINQVARQHDWETYLAYGRKQLPCDSNLIKVGNDAQVYEHYLENRIFDNEGLASRLATRRFIDKIKKIKPDIIHLHNIHDHWLNYRILFNFINTQDIPIVWTLHDCWSFTGGCHFSRYNCFKWKDGSCGINCPMHKKTIFDKTRSHFLLKQTLFSSSNLTLVTVSHWLESIVKDSFLKNKKLFTIHNGVDLNKFTPTDSSNVRIKYGIGNYKYVLGVSSVWLPYKGWNDFLQLSSMLPNNVKLVLVGLTQSQLDIVLKRGIIGIKRTENVEELAALYSGAELFLNLSCEETLGMTTIESMACGTPVVVYNATAVPEPVIDNTGWIVEKGDLNGVLNVVDQYLQLDNTDKDRINKKCLEWVNVEFNKFDRYKEYVSLYDELLKNRK